VENVYIEGIPPQVSQNTVFFNPYRNMVKGCHRYRNKYQVIYRAVVCRPGECTNKNQRYYVQQNYYVGILLVRLEGAKYTSKLINKEVINKGKGIRIIGQKRYPHQNYYFPRYRQAYKKHKPPACVLQIFSEKRIYKADTKIHGYIPELICEIISYKHSKKALYKAFGSIPDIIYACIIQPFQKNIDPMIGQVKKAYKEKRLEDIQHFLAEVFAVCFVLIVHHIFVTGNKNEHRDGDMHDFINYIKQKPTLSIRIQLQYVYQIICVGMQYNYK